MASQSGFLNNRGNFVVKGINLTDPFGIRAASKRIAGMAEDVRISMDAVEKVGGQFSDIDVPQWDARLHFFDGTERSLNWLFALDSVNFSFWPDPGGERWQAFYDKEWMDGYKALAAALKRAVEEGFAVWNPAFLASIPEQRLRYILRGKGEIPLFEARLKNLRETGEVLLRRFEGSAANLMKEAENSAVSFVRLVVENFSSFQDIGFYKGIRIPFYKRAQLLSSDIYLAFQKKSYGSMRDMESLTAFADYKVPQILRKLGILVYSKKLSGKVDSGSIIDKGSLMEIEIRAGTVHAVELLTKSLMKKGKAVHAFQLDGWLWNLSQEISETRIAPYHLTRTIDY